MELKRFQVTLNSGENLLEEAGGTISDARKECHKIWEAARALTEEVGLNRIEGLETTPPKDSWTEASEAAHRAKEENLRQVKDLGWEHVKALVDETRMQTRIESWITRAEISLRKKIMKGVCQSTHALEGYRAKSLVPLTEVHDQWEAFFDQQDQAQHEAGGSSSAPEIVQLDSSE